MGDTMQPLQTIAPVRFFGGWLKDDRWQRPPPGSRCTRSPLKASVALRNFYLEYDPASPLSIFVDQNFVSLIDGPTFYMTREGASIPLKSVELIEIFQRDGLSAFGDLDGQFSIILYDARIDTVHFARDHFGTRPLFVGKSEEGLWFGDRQRDILALGKLDRALDQPAISHFLRRSWPLGGTTLLAAIHPSKPGAVEVYRQQEPCCLHLIARSLTTERANARVINSNLRSLIEESLRSLLVSTAGPIGISLSGGIDSTAVAAITRYLFPQRELRTFTVGFGDDDPEILGARTVSKHLGTIHRELLVTAADLERSLDRALSILEIPGGHDEFPCLEMLWRLAQGHCEVLLSGNGADTLFAGMSVYRFIWWRARIRQMSRYLVRPTSYPGFEFIECGSRTSPVHHGERPLAQSVAPYRLSRATERTLDHWDERLSVQSGLARHYGLELLMPLCSRKIIYKALASRDSLKMSLRQNKRMLRQAITDLVPERILLRKKGVQQLRYDGEMVRFLCNQLNVLSETDHPIVHPRGKIAFSDLADRLLRSPDRPTIHEAWNAISVQKWAAHIFGGSEGFVDPSIRGDAYLADVCGRVR